MSKTIESYFMEQIRSRINDCEEYLNSQGSDFAKEQEMMAAYSDIVDIIADMDALDESLKQSDEIINERK